MKTGAETAEVGEVAEEPMLEPLYWVELELSEEAGLDSSLGEVRGAVLVSIAAETLGGG